MNTVRVILRSIYLRGVVDGRKQKADMSWEDSTIALLKKLVESQKATKYGIRHKDYNIAVDNISELFR